MLEGEKSNLKLAEERHTGRDASIETGGFPSFEVFAADARNHGTVIAAEAQGREAHFEVAATRETVAEV